MAKERLDVLVMEHGFAQSREKAKALIMAGEIFVDGMKEDKAGMKFSTEALIEYRGNPIPYVGRGGLKLEKALAVFSPDLTGRVCMDVGSSTGGFTDCMLQNGAVKVYSVDVGRGQLAWKLREDPRVVCMEKTNIRYLTADAIEERPSFVSIDVSFISLTKVLLPVRELMTEQGEIVCLVKPQFEAGREKVGKKGVVRDAGVHEDVIRQVALYAESIGFTVCGIDFSPIKGPEGNIEYLLYLKRNELPAAENGVSAEQGSECRELRTAMEEQDAEPSEQTAEMPQQEEASPESAWEKMLQLAVRQSHETLT